ncbi:hypothetical protein ACFYW6_40070 [Streptomyces sp. NPDC002659]|uniref:hypothetical protein n=1 Tax=Streptomyces sp. NPDC002659 TaxID=3364656 RepID=UPI00367472A7
MLEEAGVGYVLAVPKSQQVKSLAGTWRIDALIAEAPDDAWQRLSCGDDAKGPRVYHWAAAEMPAIDTFDGDTPTHRRWVLVRHLLTRPDEIACYLAYAPDGTTVEGLVPIAGSRWAIEKLCRYLHDKYGCWHELVAGCTDLADVFEISRSATPSSTRQPLSREDGFGLWWPVVTCQVTSSRQGLDS